MRRQFAVARGGGVRVADACPRGRSCPLLTPAAVLSVCHSAPRRSRGATMASGDADMEVVVDEKEKARLDEMHEKLEQGKAFHLANKPDQAEAAYKSVMAQEGDGEEFNKLKEQAICKLGELYADNNRVKDIQELMVGIRPFFSNIPKAKTAKIVRTLIELVAKVPGSTELQTQLCVETIEWCKQEKRSFLRHRIQAKLAAMYFETRDFTRAMALTEELLKEVKKLDDKVSCVCACVRAYVCVCVYYICIYIYIYIINTYIYIM